MGSISETVRLPLLLGSSLLVLLLLADDEAEGGGRREKRLEEDEDVEVAEGAGNLEKRVEEGLGGAELHRIASSIDSGGGVKSILRQMRSQALGRFVPCGGGCI
jgi:hypothetical protein